MGFIPIARIVGMHGLKGFLKLQVLTDFPSQLSIGSRLKLDGEWVTVKATSLHQGRLLVQLDGYASRTLAEPLRFKTLDAPEITPAMEEGEYRISDLVGCSLVTSQGELLGKVDEVMQMPAQDVLVVGDIMVPFVKEFVRNVDIKARKITVELIPGMIPMPEVHE